MYQVEFFENRDEYDSRRPDSTFTATTLDDALDTVEALQRNNPDSVVSVGRV